MSEISKEVSYLKGLADGMKLSEKSDEGMIIAKLIEVLDSAAEEIEILNKRNIELEERIDESELEAENLNTVSEDELEDYEDDGDEFFTNILDEDDIPDEQIFTDLDEFGSEE